MKSTALADSIGFAMLAAMTAMPLGCVPEPKVAKADPEPFIAVTGNYSIMVTGAHPTPAPSPPPAPGPKPDGCLEGCKCNGTGKERTGDGLALVPCRCPDTCACKAVRHPPVVIKAPDCSTGSCRIK